MKTFYGGAIGIQLSNQQYALKGLTFSGCNVGIYISHVFVATIQDVTFQYCNYGIDMSTSSSTGAISLVDSSISSCGAGIYTSVSGNGEGSIVIDNFNVGSGVIAVKSTSGSTLLASSVTAGNTWVMGNENPQNYQSGKTYKITRPTALISGGKYYTKTQPQVSLGQLSARRTIPPRVPALEVILELIMTLCEAVPISTEDCLHITFPVIF